MGYLFRAQAPFQIGETVNTEKRIPGIDSWIRINPADSEDVKRAQALSYDEDWLQVADALESTNYRVVVFLKNGHTVVLPEDLFELLFLSDDDKDVEPAKADADSERASYERAHLRLEILRTVLPRVQETDPQKIAADLDAWMFTNRDPA